MLPAFPFPLWNKDILINLDNLLGRFVALERDFHLIYDKRIAKILVEVDITKGLISEIDIVTVILLSPRDWIICICHSGVTFVMKLDTSGIPAIVSVMVYLLGMDLTSYLSLICPVLNLVTCLLFPWRIQLNPLLYPVLILVSILLIP